MGKRSTLTGGKPIPFITSNADGSYDISTTKTPPFVEREYIVPSFDNNELTQKLQHMKKGANWMGRLAHIPIPVSDTNESVPPLIGVFILADENTGNILGPICTVDYPNQPRNLLIKLADYIYDIDICPQKITVSDKKTYLLIKDF